MKNDALRSRLARASEINITVTGRKSGRAISIPIWFVFDEGKLYLLPVKGSDTQWYKNVVKNTAIHLEVRGAKAEGKAVAITDAEAVKSVIEKFRAKYAGDVKKYYSKFDVAVVVDIE
jgi:deazaflavin-dependent oxidoreductase (nitroreductase family)